MTIGIPEQQQENPAIARVRQFAAAVRRGLSGEQPQIGVSPVMDRREYLNRMAGQAASPLLRGTEGQGGGDQSAPPQGPGAGGQPANFFGQHIAELARMRGRSPMAPGQRLGQMNQAGGASY